MICCSVNMFKCFPFVSLASRSSEISWCHCFICFLTDNLSCIYLLCSGELLVTTISRKDSVSKHNFNIFQLTYRVLDIIVLFLNEVCFHGCFFPCLPDCLQLWTPLVTPPAQPNLCRVLCVLCIPPSHSSFCHILSWSPFCFSDLYTHTHKHIYSAGFEPHESTKRGNLEWTYFLRYSVLQQNVTEEEPEILHL